MIFKMEIMRERERRATGQGGEKRSIDGMGYPGKDGVVGSCYVETKAVNARSCSFFFLYFSFFHRCCLSLVLTSVEIVRLSWIIVEAVPCARNPQPVWNWQVQGLREPKGKGEL